MEDIRNEDILTSPLQLLRSLQLLMCFFRHLDYLGCYIYIAGLLFKMVLVILKMILKMIMMNFKMVMKTNIDSSMEAFCNKLTCSLFRLDLFCKVNFYFISHGSILKSTLCTMCIMKIRILLTIT
ncbi:unnamed protein product [Trifolium pratense]|uniref:Uncharacterized protein n=1 Tax=Trifolium pratense TaxID=57577 RepID=A0ACB0KIU4_TRIPR|nr:unnamed protein product [Trifolium pratense]